MDEIDQTTQQEVVAIKKDTFLNPLVSVATKPRPTVPLVVSLGADQVAELKEAFDAINDIRHQMDAAQTPAETFHLKKVYFRAIENYKSVHKKHLQPHQIYNFRLNQIM